MRKRILIILTALVTCACLLPINAFAAEDYDDVFARKWGETVLYDRSTAERNDDIIGTQSFDGSGLIVNGTKVLNKYYSVSDRTVSYTCRFGADTVALFETVETMSPPSGANSVVRVSLPGKTVKISSLPARECPILNGADTFSVSVTKRYQNFGVEIRNLRTGEKWNTYSVTGGSGGVGKGAVAGDNGVGMQHDYYAVDTESGTPFSLSAIRVTCAKCEILIYGDSITEPESYWPSELYAKSWTQLVIAGTDGRAMTSGRGGTTIYQIMQRIGNELPYIKPRYCMVTIGTNGGSTVETLTELVRYIKSQGVIPILNHIPCYDNNGDTTGFIAVNGYVDTVRRNEGIGGCDLDVATSVDNDGVTVDRSTMWWEDYSGSSYLTGSNYYHHPNEKGSAAMYAQIGQDAPEIFTHEHSFTAVNTAKPTCTETGTAECKCSLCGEEKTEILNATGHKFSHGRCTVCGKAEPGVAGIIRRMLDRIMDVLRDLFSWLPFR